MKRQQQEDQILRTLSRNALKRNWVSATVLVLFVALSAMLAGSAAALIITGGGATASLMTQARTPHFLQMHAGELDEQRLAAFAAGSAHVELHEVVPMLNVDATAIRVTGPTTDTNLAAGLQDNSFVTQNAKFDFLLNTDGQVIQPLPGTVWLPLFYRESLGLDIGDVLSVSGPGGEARLWVAGFLRDSQMNFSYSSSKRLLVSYADKAAVTDVVGETGHVEYLIQFRLTDPSVVGEFEAQYRDAGLEANGPAITWKLFVLVNSLSTGITAAIVGLVTLLLVGIALLCVRFTLLTTIEQDYREVGVLKAVGVRASDIRSLYSRRYLMLAAAGALLGLIASLGLSRLLLRDVELFMGTAGSTVPALLSGVLLSALIVVIVAFAVHGTLRRLNQVSGVQALRSGAPSEPATAPRSKGRRFPLMTARLGINVSLGLHDLVRRSGLYVVPLVIFTLASFILIVPQNLYATVTRPDFITYMGAGVSDMRIDLQTADIAKRAEELGITLAQDPRIESFSALSTASYIAEDADGVKAVVKVESGDLAAFPLTYLDGRAPTTDDQIALSQLQADALDVSIGATLALTPAADIMAAAGQLELTVTGIYQDITNGGKTAKMVAAHNGAREHNSARLMWVTVYADFEPGVDVEAAIEDYAASNPGAKVSSVAGFLRTTLGGTIDALRGASIASLVVGLAVAALITALFMPLLIARDAFSIAVMKAIGFRFGHIQRQYVVRSLVVLALGVVLGAVLANTLGGGLAGLMLTGAGLSHLQLVANGWLAYLASPLALLAVVVITTLASSRPGNRLSITSTIKE